MYSQSVNNSVIYYHQFLTTGSHFVLIIHNYNTAVSSTGKLFKPKSRTDLHGKNSMIINGVNSWNKIQIAFGDLILKNLTTTQMKILLTKKCIDKY